VTPSVERRHTNSFPVVQRAPLLYFRRVSTATLAFFQGIGQRALFLRDLKPHTALPLVMPQLRAIGVDSVPLVIMVASFIGGVISLQIRYQLFAGIQLTIVGLSVRQIVILETGPLLTGLVLAGQIDALETLSYDPVAYLVVPRLIAAVVMLPVLTIIANVCGVLSGMLAAVTLTDVQMSAFIDGVRLGYDPFQVTYSLIKSTLFGAAIAYLCTFEGYVTQAGAEGVGKATAKAVVISSIWILVLDAVTAILLAPYLQG